MTAKKLLTTLLEKCFSIEDGDVSYNNIRTSRTDWATIIEGTSIKESCGEEFTKELIKYIERNRICIEKK